MNILFYLKLAIVIILLVIVLYITIVPALFDGPYKDPQQKEIDALAAELRFRNDIARLKKMALNDLQKKKKKHIKQNHRK